MWPFKKKRKRIPVEGEAKSAEDQDSVLLKRALEGIVEQADCPKELKESGICVCVSCPKRGTCNVEKICKSALCISYPRACSVKSALEGKENENGVELMMESMYQALRSNRIITIIK